MSSNEKSPAETPSATPEDAFESARDRLRETVKWLIASFGAIGASLALGSQISGVGKIDGWRLAIALVGAIAGFAGVFGAMTVAVKVLTGSHTSLGELGRESEAEKKSDLVKFFETENPQMLGEFKTLAELRTRFLEVIAENNPDERRRLGRRIRAIGNVASFEKLRMTFDRNLKWIMGSLALAAVGVLAFAWAANPSENEEAQAPSAGLAAAVPVAARLSLTESGRAQLATELGTNCSDEDIPAVALGADEKGVDVATLPTSNCDVIRFTLTPDLGMLTPTVPACQVVKNARDQEEIECGVFP